MMLCGGLARAQNNPQPSTSTRPAQATPAAQPRQASFDLSEYGVKIQPDARLIVLMAALDAAGFDPLPEGQRPSPFRAQVRREQADLDADLRARLRRFYEGHRLHQENSTPPTAAEQASRYVSLAYALGPAPSFEAPARTDDLPAGLLEVLDFAPLVREFYRKSGIDERLPGYLRSYVAAGDELRQGTSVMVRNVLSYLHTRPQTNIIERVPVKGPNANEKKKNAPVVYTTRERERRFFIVPDLLAVPGSINFRVIGDDYYVVVPAGTNPSSSELRRAYLQYVIDPFILRYNREVTERRDALRKLIDEVAKTSTHTLSPDVYLTVARSLVAATETRLDELARLDALSRRTQAQLAQTSDTTKRAAIVRQSQAEQARINDEAIVQLSEAYERGAVLAFYFTEQLRGTETSGFDIIGSFADMIASFDTAREARRLMENAEARTRGLAAQKARRDAQKASQGDNVEADESSPRTVLLKNLIEIDELLRQRNYTEAEARLRSLLRDFPGEPRIFFALGETASLSAREATDEEVRDQRLNGALANYHLAVNAASMETEPGLLSRAHEAMGSILAFLERNDEAMMAFDAAIKIGRDVPNNAYDKAVEGKKRLTQPQ
jgi:tetratricopeptide (TPR) repeat protein